MGLAASQARFLAITARKANCEFQSMQIAQEKLSTTRELERATEEYQSSLNKTKLVWDPDGSGENAFDLSYDLMMRPSAVNNYTPYLMTTRDGRIVLDSKMAAAARQAGIPEGGCERSAELYEKFLNQMVKNGGMSETSAAVCKSMDYEKDFKNVGLGGPMLDKTQASEMGINDLIAYIDNTISKSGTGAEKELADALQFEFGVDDKGNSTLDLQTVIKDKGYSNSNYFLVNGNKTTDTNFTFSDLLTSDITFARTGDKNSTKWWKKVLAGVMSAFAGGFGFMTYCGLKGLLGVDKGGYPEGYTEADIALFEFLDQMFTAFYELIDVESGGEAAEQAFQYAIQETLALLAGCKDLGNRNHSTDAFNDAVNEADNYNGWVQKNANKDKNYGTQAISLSNLTESFMTLYAQGINGYDDTYYINKPSKKSNYVTDDPYYMWTVKNPNANTAMDMYINEFYSALFNNICQSGWTEDPQIDDNEYLGNTLKNARYFIASLSTDNYYYQDKYMDNSYVVEVTDEDAITQAELAYTQKKSKLNYKEERLELDMKQLDLEISSLTTEYDTVKNLINNNVEKTFTMFNS